MDHRCLYGHRVSESLAFAIQNRTCPQCGAPTVTVNGYQAARRLAADGGIESVQSFNAIRLLEAEWTLAPIGTGTAPVATPTTAPLAAVETGALQPAVAPEEDEVVVDETALASAAPPEPRIKPVTRGARPKTEDRSPEKKAGTSFDPGEEDFFKGA